MAALIDAIIYLAKDKAKGGQFIDALKSINTAEDLEKWFITAGFKGISLEECEKIIVDKEDFLHKGDVLLNNKSNY